MNNVHLGENQSQIRISRQLKILLEGGRGLPAKVFFNFFFAEKMHLKQGIKIKSGP